MSGKKQSRLQINAGTGMALGAILGGLIALVVSAITGDQSVWSWAVPVGLATGLAIGAGRQRGPKNNA
jgi:hypothetical protein